MAVINSSQNGTTNYKCYFQVVVNETSVSTSNNTSTISWTLYKKCVSGNNWSATHGWNLKINGQVVSTGGTESQATSGGSYFIANGDMVIAHDNDGSKTIRIEITGAFYDDHMTVSGSQDIVLTNISRGPEINTVSFTNLVSAMNVTFTQKSNYSYKLRVSIPDVVMIARFDSYTSGQNVTLTTSQIATVYSHLASRNLGSCLIGFVLETYQGTTSIGESREINIQFNRESISTFVTNKAEMTTPSSITVTITKNCNHYTHKLIKKLNNQAVSTTTPTTTETYTLTSAVFGQKYPNSKTGMLQIVLETYYDTVLIGSNSTNINVTLENYTLAAVNTAISYAYTNSVVQSWNVPVYGYTSAIITISNVMNKYSATTSKYYLNEVVTTSNRNTVALVNGTNTINCGFIDSRNVRSTSSQIVIDVAPYTKPVLSNFDIFRTTGQVADLEGVNLGIAYTISYSECFGNNSYKVELIQINDTAETVLGILEQDIIENNRSVTVYNLDTFSLDTVYRLKIRITDALGNYTESPVVTIAQPEVVWSASSSGRGFNIGRAKNEDGFNVYFDADFKQNIKLKGTDIFNLIYPVGSIYMSVNNVNPSTLFGGTWVSWGNGRVPVGVSTSDSSFNTVEKTGGSKTSSHNHSSGTLIANIGAYDASPAKIGYNATNKNTSVIYNYGGLITSQESNIANSRINHGTSVGGSTGSTSSSTVQPYITCYMWKRTG